MSAPYFVMMSSGLTTFRLIWTFSRLHGRNKLVSAGMNFKAQSLLCVRAVFDLLNIERIPTLQQVDRAAPFEHFSRTYISSNRE